MNIIKTKINDILDLLFFRPMNYLMLEGDKKNMFIKPLYFIACMLVLLFNMILLFGCGVLIFGLFLIIFSILVSPLNNHPNIQIAIFLGIIIYIVCFYLVNFTMKEE
jgi:drug/metabolite transporter (DMT)-like permease